MKKYFKFITELEIDEEEILLYPITSEDVQSRINKNIDDIKLYRIFIALCCVDSIRENINRAIDEAIELALDNDEPMWKEVDIEYNEEILNS